MLTATNLNTEVSAKERKHRKAKDVARHSNKKDLTRDFLGQENSAMVLHHLLDGGIKNGISAGAKLLAMKDSPDSNFLFSTRHKSPIPWSPNEIKRVSTRQLQIPDLKTFQGLLEDCYRTELNSPWKFSHLPGYLDVISDFNLGASLLRPSAFIKLPHSSDKFRVLHFFQHKGLDLINRNFAFLQQSKHERLDPYLGWEVISLVESFRVVHCKVDFCTPVVAEHNCLKECPIKGGKLDHHGPEFLVNPYLEK